jgi:ligand-binding sensor domain-containing protein/serine phosphatase RsbU (regulator of sigma subunit)
MKIKLKYLIPLLLLSACTGKKETDTMPAPLFPQPQTVEVNTGEGYTVNPVTGESVQSIITESGDTLLTGVPIEAKGKVVHPDSVAQPKVVQLPKLDSSINAHPNVHKIPDDLTVILVNKDSLTTVLIEQLDKKDTSHYLVNSTGDIIKTGIPILAQGKAVTTTQPTTIKALAPRYKDAAITNLQYLDVDQGMASSYVLSILEDKEGNLWFGTNGGGVSRYDGKFFTHFTKQEGLSNNTVWSILEDKKGNLWFGINGGGVSRYDGESFTHFTEKQGLSNNTVNSILEDKEGNLWFGTNGGGVSRYDGEFFTHFTEKEGLSNNTVNSILEDKEGNLWFGTAGGVSRYDGEFFTHFTEKEGLSNNTINSILEDKEGNLWFGTNGGGVSRYDGESFTHFTEKQGLSNNTIWSILEDKEGNLWFGTNGGVNRYDGEYFTHFTEKQGLSNNTVNSILEDKEGNLWFGTYGGGVSRYNGKSFIHFTDKIGLSNNTIWSILEDKDGILWFGISGGGVSRYDGESFTHFTDKQGLSNNTVLSILEDKEGNLWFGTNGGGVSCYDGKSLTHFTEKQGLSNNTVWSILEDQEGNLWFGTDGGGVSRYDGKSFTHFTEKQGLSNNTVLTTLEDKDGNLWFGTYGGGVSRYDGESFTHFTEKQGLSNNFVNSILEDKKGNLWFGTNGGGVSRYDGVDFTHFTEKQGLSNNTVWSILEDKEGDLWFSTEKGISLLAQEKLTKIKEEVNTTIFQVFEKNDGLKVVDFYPNSACLDSKNRLWWGSGKSLTMLDLKNFDVAIQPPSVYLRQLDINEQFVDYRNITDNLGDKIEFSGVQEFENYPLDLELPYDKNHLTFHFSAIDWSAPHKIQYSYLMDGLNDNWSIPSYEAKADYRNLPYGSYIFKVRAIGESGGWSESFEYTFTIHPPWWHSWWARTGYGIAGILLVFGFVRWRTTKLKQRQKELETEVELATEEIRQQKTEAEYQRDFAQKEHQEAERQRHIVVEKNTEILDSIQYTKRLQDAILPSVKLVKEYFEESFILFRPKDIVSGDFYWLNSIPTGEEGKDNLIMFAAADCTGHGVPGAMVSVVCANALNKSVNELGKTDPADILNTTRELVIDTFSKSGDDVKDGMDISLCVLNEGTKTLHWAGANNPLWIVREDLNEIEVIKADKQPIGTYGESKPFTSHSIKINVGDNIYMFSDGYTDQFGGERGKKMKSVKFKKLLLEHRNENMEEQKKALEQAFEEWKGDLEQIDDVCVIGVKI